MNFDTIIEVFNEIKNFVTGADFQAFVTAAIGVYTAFALLNNKVAALKVANTQNTLNAQNIDISKLQEQITTQQETIVNLTKKIDLQSGMFSAAFLNSKKLDSQTKQEIAKFAKTLTEIKVPNNNLLEKVVETANQVISSPIVETVTETATNLFEKMKTL